MVVNADAVVKPGTVVVESFYTPIANSAVLGTRSPQHFAIRTHLTGMHFGQQLNKGQLRSQIPRISSGCYKE